MYMEHERFGGYIWNVQMLSVSMEGININESDINSLNQRMIVP